MANARVVTTKSVRWRGGQEEFSNGYTFQADAGPWSQAQWQDLCDDLVSMERAIHANNVTFVRVQAGPQGQPAALVQDLTGTGSFPTSASVLQPEVCLLAQWRIARRRWLMKYFHIGKHPGTIDGDVWVATTPYTTQLAKLTDGSMGPGVKICAPDGTLSESTCQLDPYMRVHQFPRGRRRPTAP